MMTAVQKWGNSLALRIPKAYAEETQIRDGSCVDLSLQEGNLVITPVRKKTFTLEELLKDITPDNRHEAIDSGFAVGAEVW
ncbi:MAG: AbrB/MazE/SpoVT family DNA-binding domain-containing protein [Chthoniobacteraceae bacterium]|nr:AbrB/MazE/SpoVT family DNA-binding domain-containing protein [Chthoniobacteraceae bacterium]